MKRIIICEKPSAARNFAKALGGDSGTFEGEPYMIMSLRGHMAKFKDLLEMVPDEKKAYYKKWALENLPWDKADIRWSYTLIPGCEKEVAAIGKEIKDADEVVIGTDDDPSGEGELLAWEVLSYVHWKGPTYRMYFQDEAPSSIQKAFRERKRIPGMMKDGDFVKAFARSRWDYLSMQFTRIATCVASEKGYRFVIREGRLKSVMVSLVGKQIKAYDSYEKKPFYEARFKDENGNVYSRKEEIADRKDKAEDVDLTAFHASTVDVDEEKMCHEAPPKLLDLASLSAILTGKGYKPQNILDTYQKMYEDQVVSYPRTEDKAITIEQFNELLPLADRIAAVVGVDVRLLTHRSPRSTHIKSGLAHGANRPGTHVPSSLADLAKYGREAAAIYEILAKNYLTLLGEDYEYLKQTGHVHDFPDFKGSTNIPKKLGFKEIFQTEKDDDDENANGKELGKNAEPFVHEGCNKRPPYPTMKWLVKQLEKYNVGTGATRTSTLAEISKAGDDKALMEEAKGKLSLTPCGNVSYILLEGCLIASVEATEQLFGRMKSIGKFEESPDKLLEDIAPMVEHDLKQMKENASNLSSVSGSGNTVNAVGVCPVCGKPVIKAGKIFSCSSNKNKKDENGNWVQSEGCGFKMFGEVYGKALTDNQAEYLLAGKKVLIKGLKSKAGKTYNAYFILDGESRSDNGFWSAKMEGFANSRKGR